MRMRTLGIAAALSAGVIQSSDAVVRPKGADDPIVSADRAPRTHRTVATSQLPGGLAGWTAIVDRDTDVPLRLWGSTSPISGAVADPAIAEAAARQFLAAHLATLAPGATVADFALVSNELSPKGDIRSVGFVQRVNGMRVVGGAIGVSFKRDRIALVSSTALPHVAAARPLHRLSTAVAVQSATSWLAADGHAVAAAANASLAASEPLVIPIVRPRRGAAPDITYRVAEQISVTAKSGPGSWIVWVDAADGAPIARKSTIHYASGKVLYDVPDRYPGSTRTAHPAAGANITVDGATAMVGLDGTVTWSGAGASTLRVRGPLISISTAGTLATAAMQLMSGGSVTWSSPTTETVDAQLSGFIHAGIVKQFTKTRLNPNLAWLGATLTVSVNESGTCNAFSTGDDIHFLRKGTQCENTARLADVVYHEFGHSLHAHSIIEGVGSWDGALSEGLSDILAMLITHDHGMGRGFFLSNPSAAMRDLNPPNKEKKWGVDTTGEVHDDGEIIGGTFWDLMVALEAQLGANAGFEKTLDIYYSVMQRASDIPSSYPEALLGDDDDGDLANGTPNKCAIHAAFAAHALASGPTPTGTVDKPLREGFTISVKAMTGDSMSACPSPSIASAVIDWRLRGGSDAPVALTLVNDKFVGDIPSQPNGSVVQYKITLTLTDGSKVVYPNNPADDHYEMYVGPVTPIWCADFEAGATDWTHGATPATGDEWEAGAPAGLGNDPKTAYAGSGVFGLDLTKDGVYRASIEAFAESPEIDLAGHTAVRMQYQRWLGVEDGFYDRSKLLVNGTEVWANYASATEPQQNGTHHLDREWRFADFDLASQAGTGKVKLRFELTSDQGLQFGGWTMDDVCLVTPAMGPGDPMCGNGAVDTGEACDDGNVTDGDGCSAVCETEGGGGGGGDNDDPEAGCCSVERGGVPRHALLLALLTFGVLVRKRRRG